jgi:hypothetical protein
MRSLRKNKNYKLFGALEKKLKKSDSLIGMEYKDIFNELNEIFVKFNPSEDLKPFTLKDFENERELLDGCSNIFDNLLFVHWRRVSKRGIKLWENS